MGCAVCANVESERKLLARWLFLRVVKWWWEKWDVNRLERVAIGRGARTDWHVIWRTGEALAG